MRNKTHAMLYAFSSEQPHGALTAALRGADMAQQDAINREMAAELDEHAAALGVTMPPQGAQQQ